MIIIKQKLTASDPEANDYFGGSVSISSDGNTAIVGAQGGAGAAYVFTLSGETWTEQQKLTASDPEAGDYFGRRVRISPDGNTAIIGAPGEGSAGAAYVFTRSGKTWTEQQKLTASDPEAGDSFGRSVSISDDGNTAIIGAHGETDYTGAAYVFTLSGTWTEQQKLTANDGDTDDGFGGSVSISDDGNTAIVGAYGADEGSQLVAGGAYIFTRSGETWTEQQKLTASDAEANAYFGHSVSISPDGNTAIIGAYNASSAAGSAYIFTRSGETWTEQQKLTASDAEAGDGFGGSVSISDDSNTVIVGAYGDNSNTGAAYIFTRYITRAGETWTEQQKLTVGDGDADDYFGGSVSISDGNAIVGADYATNEGGSHVGEAYIFSEPPEAEVPVSITEITNISKQVIQIPVISGIIRIQPGAQFSIETDKVSDLSPLLRKRLISTRNRRAIR